MMICNCPDCGGLLDETLICFLCFPLEYLDSHRDSSSQYTPATTLPSGDSHYNPGDSIDPQLSEQPQLTTSRVNRPVLRQPQPVPEAPLFGTPSPRPDPLKELDPATRASISAIEQFNRTHNTRKEEPLAVNHTTPPGSVGLRSNDNASLKAVGDRFYSLSERRASPQVTTRRQPLAPRRDRIANPVTAPQSYHTQLTSPQPSEVSIRGKQRAQTKWSSQREAKRKTGRAIQAGSDQAMHCCDHDWETPANLARHQRWCKKAERITSESAVNGNGWYCKPCNFPFAKRDDWLRHLKSNTHPETEKTVFTCPRCAAEVKVSDKSGFNAKRHLINKHAFSREDADTEYHRVGLRTVPITAV